MTDQKPLRIGHDCDDVIFETLRILQIFHNEQYGTNLGYEDITDFEIKNVWNCTGAEAYDRINHFFSTHHHDTLNLVEDAKRSLSELDADGHLQFVVSSRPFRMEEKTKELFRRNLPEGLIQGYTMLQNGCPEATGTRTKGDVALESQFDICTEDAPHNALAIAEQGIPVLLYTRPWNKEYTHLDDHDFIHRVHSWDEILEFIKRLRR